MGYYYSDGSNSDLVWTAVGLSALGIGAYTYFYQRDVFDKAVSDIDAAIKNIFSSIQIPQVPTTPNTPPIIVNPNNPPPTSPSGMVDANGIKLIYPVTGNFVNMQEGSDHRNGKRYNVNHKYQNYMMIGYFKTGKGQDQIEMKSEGPNHSGCTSESNCTCLWAEAKISIGGEPDIQFEFPHPVNNPSVKSKTSYLKSIGSIAQKWLGYCVLVYTDPSGKRVLEQWADPDPFDANGRPKNGWVLTLKVSDLLSIAPSGCQNRKLPVDYNNGLEAEIRMNNGTAGDTAMKWCRVYELKTPITSGFADTVLYSFNTASHNYRKLQRVARRRELNENDMSMDILMDYITV